MGFLNFNFGGTLFATVVISAWLFFFRRSIAKALDGMGGWLEGGGQIHVEKARAAHIVNDTAELELGIRRSLLEDEQAAHSARLRAQAEMDPAQLAKLELARATR